MQPKNLLTAAAALLQGYGTLPEPERKKETEELPGAENTYKPAIRLKTKISQVYDTCIDCPKCREECAFLERYGTPRAIIDAYNPEDPAFLRMAYECSLCGLCSAVCPVGLNPEEMFLEMRRAAVLAGKAPLGKYQRLLAYEKRGTSRRYTFYSLPENCDTVFFPGCALSGTRPGKTLALYNHLKTLVSGIGIVLDCCCKPSRDLGRTGYFSAMLSEMKSFLTSHGIKRILTACPNCHMVFATYGQPIEAISVYQVLAEKGLPPCNPAPNHSVVIHDACVTRYDGAVQDAVRKIARTKGLSLAEMTHNRSRTLCCGEGGGAGRMDARLSGKWTARRKKEAAGRPLLAYCAGCTQTLKGNMPAFHIIDILFDPACITTGNPRASTSPVTYLNRLWLKHALKKQESPAVSRERTYSPQSASTW